MFLLSRTTHTGSHAAVHPEAVLTGPSHYLHNKRVETSHPPFSVPQAHPLPPPALALNASHSHPAHDVLSEAAESQKPLTTCQNIKDKGDFIK